MNDDNGVALLRQTLAAQAQTVTLPPGLTDTVRARARRGAVRRRIAAVAAAVAVMAGVGVTVTQLPASPKVSVASLVPAWPERGTSAHDTAFIGAALSAWNASTGTQHTLR
ncbi:MAG TPA: hypothetical protein VN738_05670, partial [Acidothermaceae bacterium]|nr:hypothetical protein [Acidothermaceae bacterium]